MKQNICETCGIDGQQAQTMLLVADRYEDNECICSGCMADRLERRPTRDERMIAHLRGQDTRNTDQRQRSLSHN